MYGVLLAGERVVALAQPRAHALHAHDLLLLASFVLGSGGFRAAAESFSPLCLPRFNPAAFLHAYVRFLDEVRLCGLAAIPAFRPAGGESLSAFKCGKVGRCIGPDQAQG